MFTKREKQSIVLSFFLFFTFVVMTFKWLSALAGFLYIILGIVVIIYKFFIIVLEPIPAYSLGTLMILYGVFRVLRVVYKANRKQK